MNVHTAARNFEAALRKMWGAWCQGRESDSIKWNQDEEDQEAVEK